MENNGKEIDSLVKEVDHAELVLLDGADVRSRFFRVGPSNAGRAESIICNKIRNRPRHREC